jgi:hypothetical protein
MRIKHKYCEIDAFPGDRTAKKNLAGGTIIVIGLDITTSESNRWTAISRPLKLPRPSSL